MSEIQYPWSKSRSNHAKMLELLIPEPLLAQLRAESTRARGIMYPSDAELDMTYKLIMESAAAFDGEPPQPAELLDAGLGRPFRIAGVHPTDDPMVFEVQTGAPEYGYYLGTGHGSYSGGFDPIVTIRVVDEQIKFMMARYWIFWCGRGGANCGVHFDFPTRLFKVQLLQGRWPSRRERTEFRYSYNDPVDCWRH
jgi:hypothetical protein